MIKAIIVDDEYPIVTIIKFFIEKDHLPIEIVGHATNGAEAISLIEKERPLIVFIDVKMPILDGFEVMKRLPGWNYIIITAYDYFEYAQQGLRLGAKDILLKPIEYPQFLAAIARTIGWQFTGSEIVNELLELIHAEYTSSINLSRLASEVHSTPDYISRVFKKHMQISINAYVHQLRINKAASLLGNNTYSIQEICEMVGYESMNNFYKYFKQYKGATPASYRASLLLGES